MSEWTENIRRAAIESGLCDAELSSATQLVTEYGDATEAIERFARLITLPTWTAVAEKLPDADITVLLALDDGEVWPGYLDGNTWRYVTADPLGSRVTHWMDFPEPPK